MRTDHRTPCARYLLVAAAVGTLAITPLFAHDTTPEPAVDLTFRPMDDRLAVQARVPIAALADANLPRTSNGHYLQADVAPALRLVAQALGSDLEVMEGDQRLAAPTIDARISADEAFVDIDYVFAIRQDSEPRLSARVVTFRAGAGRLPTLARYATKDGSLRTFRVEGEPRRIEFEPSLSEALQHALGRGLDGLRESSDYLLFAFCLAAPLAARRPWFATPLVLVTGEALAMLLSGFHIVVLTPQALVAVQALGASTIAVAAMLNLGEARARWMRPVAFVSGLSLGFTGGDAFLQQASFAGAHAGLALIAFLAVVAIGQLWIVALLSAAFDLIVRWRVPARILILAVAVFCAHTALHRMVERSELMAATGSWVLDRWLVVLTLGWAMAILCAGIVNALWTSPGSVDAERLTGEAGP